MEILWFIHSQNLIWKCEYNWRESCYDEGKRVGETLMYEYRKKYGIDTKIVRIFNTYGPYMDLKDGRL